MQYRSITRRPATFLAPLWLVLLALVALLVAGDFIFTRGEGTNALVLGLSQLAHKRMVE